MTVIFIFGLQHLTLSLSQKKYVKDTFDKKKAIKGWQNVTQLAVTKYTRDYGSPGTFNAAEKEMLGEKLYDYYEDIMKANFKKARKLKK